MLVETNVVDAVQPAQKEHASAKPVARTGL